MVFRMFGRIKKNVEQIIVIPEGNYFVRVGVVDPSTFDYTYYVQVQQHFLKKEKRKPFILTEVKLTLNNIKNMV